MTECATTVNGALSNWSRCTTSISRRLPASNRPMKPLLPQWSRSNSSRTTAFAYRFDTDDGSIVFSGDTGRNENLIRLAKGADILVHEVIVTSVVNRLFPPPRSVADEGLMQHLLNAHTQVEVVGGIAEAAS